MRILEYKFPSGVAKFDLELPVGAQVIAVRTQGPQPILSVIGNTAADKEKRTFALFSNSIISAQKIDAAIPEQAEYVGCFERGGAPWFVFELCKPDEALS